MNDHTTPAERGLALEQRIERLFRSRGYEVVHDAWIAGRSGTRHQVDVLATYQAPLHSSTIVVESKAYHGSVDKDRVMKLIHIVNDVGADRGIIVTTSSFTPDAVRTAHGYNIDLWDRERLRSAVGEAEIASLSQGQAPATHVISQIVAPALDGGELRASIEQQIAKRARGTLGIGKVIETLASFEAVSFPYYEVDITVEVAEIQRVGLLRREQITKLALTTVSFDASTGAPVEPGATGIAHDFDWMASLSPDEIQTLRAMRGERCTMQQLGGAGLTDTRLKRALASLVEKGCAARTDARPAAYSPTQAIPDSPLQLQSISSAYQVLSEVELPFTPSRVQMIEPGALVRAIEVYWPGVSARSVRMLHYPYFFTVYQRADGSVRSEAIDAVTGATDETVAKLINMPVAAAAG